MPPGTPSFLHRASPSCSTRAVTLSMYLSNFISTLIAACAPLTIGPKSKPADAWISMDMSPVERDESVA